MNNYERQMLFSNKLKGLLHDRNLSQAEVAKAIGVSPQTFNTWCKGIAVPRMGKLEKIADYFDVKPSYFIDPVENTNIEARKSIDFLCNELSIADQLQCVLEQDEILNGYRFNDEQLLDILRYARFLAAKEV